MERSTSVCLLLALVLTLAVSQTPNVANCVTYANSSCTACASTYYLMPAIKTVWPSAIDECRLTCPYNTTVHTYADSTLKQCVYTCGGVTYGDLNSGGLPVCATSCTNTAYFMDNSTKTCVSACPNNTFKASSTSKTCLSTCPAGLWGDSVSGICATSCGFTSSGPTYKDNTTQLCVAVCPLPSVKDISTYSCILTNRTIYKGRWQASGNMTDFIGGVQLIIDASLVKVQQSQLTTNRLAKDISDTLNGRWNPAWNVFATNSDDIDNINSVVYGFAHNNHWMWVNGYGPYGHSFVIWKDYNCDTWVDVESAVNFNSLESPTRYNLEDSIDAVFTNDLAQFFFDPWAMAYDMAKYLNNRDPMRAYTSVVNQGHLTYYNARFCGFQGQYYQGVKKQNAYTLTYLVFRTR